MLKLAFPLLILLIIAPPLALAAVVVVAAAYGVGRLADTPSRRRASRWYANV